MSKENAAVFNKAADVMNERGQTQMSFMSSTGEVCMSAALAIAKGIEPNPLWRDFNWGDRERAATEPYIEILKKYTGDRACSFNNSHTKDECVAVFREIARKEEMSEVAEV